MPRTLHPDLEDCLRRPNPHTEYRIEVSEPDVSHVVRRTDQFTQAPTLVSMTPAAGLTTNARGSLILAPTTAALFSFAGTQSESNLDAENEQRRYKGLAWKLDPAFARATLKSVTAKIRRFNMGAVYNAEFELQVFRITKTPGVRQKNVGTPQYQATAFTEYTFTKLLTPAPVQRAFDQAWVANEATLSFDLSNWNLQLENVATKAAAPDQAGELPEYLIVVRITGKRANGTHYAWKTDTLSARDIAGLGRFDRVYWNRDSDDAEWNRQVWPDVPNIVVNIETYAATGQAIYALDLGAAPSAPSSGRAVFERQLPSGASTTLELSTAGAAGPWTAYKHGDDIAVKQRTYHARVTLNADAAGRGSPAVSAAGLEFRVPRDVSVEGVPTLPTREVDLPWFRASIPEGRLRIVRTGVRDYFDPGSIIGSTQATPKLEVDIYLASRHASVTRDKWHRLERMMVTNRTPSATSEDFTLLSYASRLKRKIPQQVETLNSVHTVAVGTTAAAVKVTPALPGTSAAGTEYDGKNYYIRVRSTTQATIPVGYVATIQGNTNTDTLDFVPALPDVLAVGDVIEVHSGIFTTAALSWVDADPATVWWEILTAHLGIPVERIGAGYLPRGGKPPAVTDRAPGDATTQAKLKVTMRLSEQENADELLDQLSAICGGVTIEIDGQIVFVQLVPLRDVSGKVVLPLPAPAAVFDQRDYAGKLSTPPGLEKRATVVRASYGVPKTAATPEQYPAKSTVAVDGDALLWLSQQDLEEHGSSEVPASISRWFYNTSDQGLYLASVVSAQLVRAASTGLRLFGIPLVEKQPHLVPGDVVVFVTDQYTDYDPASATQLRGLLAIRGVIVRAANEGKQLGVFVAGLLDNFQQVNGGGAGTLTGLGAMPDPPALSASFTPGGELIINSTGDGATASQRIAYSSAGVPSDATVRAAPSLAYQSVTNYATGSVFAPGATAYIAAFAYNGNGIESLKGSISVTREGTGVAAQPRVELVPVMVSRSQTSETVRLYGYTGVGGRDPLAYRYRIDDGAWSAWTALGANGSSVDLVVAKSKFYNKEFIGQVRDADLVESDVQSHTVWGELEMSAPGTGRLRPGTPMDTTGALPFGRGYDLASDVVETTAMKFTNSTMLDASRNIVNVYRTALNEPVGNLFKRGSDVATDVVMTASRYFVHSDQLDATDLRVTGVKRSAVNAEPVANLFKRGADTSADIVETAARNFVINDQLDLNRRVVNVYRGTANEPVPNLFKRAADTASDVVEVAGRNFIEGGMIDASRRVINVYRSAVVEGVVNLFKRGADTASDIVETATQNFVHGDQLNVNNRVVAVERGAVTGEPTTNLLKVVTDAVYPSQFQAGNVDVGFTFRAKQVFSYRNPPADASEYGSIIDAPWKSVDVSAFTLNNKDWFGVFFDYGSLTAATAKTVPLAVGLYVRAPVAGVNVTIANAYALYAEGRVYVAVSTDGTGITVINSAQSPVLNLHTTVGSLSRNWQLATNRAEWGDLIFRHSTVSGGDASAGTTRLSLTTAGGSLYGSWEFSALADVSVKLAGYNVLKWNAGSTLHIGGYTAAQWSAVSVWANGAERVRADANGGTLYGAWNVTTSFRVGNGWGVGSSDNEQITFDSSSYVRIFAGGGERLRALAAGGGTLYGSWYSTGDRLFNTEGSDTIGAALRLTWHNNAGTRYWSLQPGASADALDIWSYNGTVWAQRLRVTHTGGILTAAWKTVGAHTFESLIHVTANTTNVASSGTTVLRFLANGANLEGVWSLYNAGTPRLVAAVIPVTAFDNALTAPEGTFQAVYTP